VLCFGSRFGLCLELGCDLTVSVRFDSGFGIGLSGRVMFKVCCMVKFGFVVWVMPRVMLRAMSGWVSK
jgi:hypothetical protein